jgi:hypothetical protein
MSDVLLQSDEVCEIFSPNQGDEVEHSIFGLLVLAM